MLKNRVELVVALLIVFVLGSLTHNSLAGPDNSMQPDIAIRPVWLPSDDTTGFPPATDLSSQAIQTAIAEYATMFAVAPDSICVTSYWPIQWPSSALGCPEPGVDYRPEVTPGFVIKLQAEDKLTVNFHTNDGTTGPLRVVDCNDQ